ncbi:TetR/AcrR family transcriptional regulator [Mitsuaria sp. CC2]|jgi:TetR/AcrR family transcriptional regulator, transcriptional repressor for nem operon|uniref:TetR/AcrR family transcriptional regulator n=1 Tax=Mitsuaria sp. CC2 TaxID=3029186 RepID=UPI003B8B8F66
MTSPQHQDGLSWLRDTPAGSLSPKAAEIVVHTRRILSGGGYNSFSYADLSERVNLSKAGIHHHFPSKELLVQAVVVLSRREAEDGLDALVRELDDPLLELTAYARNWESCIGSCDSPFCIYSMLWIEKSTIPESVAEEVVAHFEFLNEWLASVLKRGAERGVLHLGASPSVSARAFMAIVQGAMLMARAVDDPLSFGAIVNPAIRRLTRPLA